ncbi:MAG: hypothetical protein AB7W59_12495 [Acidimicrobiia bacterium]
MQESPERDLEAFNLRRTGRSFGAISRDLGYDSAPAATHAFFRVLAGRERSEQEIVRDEEHGRLAALAEHVRADASLDDTTRDRRLAVLDRLHQRVNAACEGAGQTDAPT